MKIEIPKDWCRKSAAIEGDSEIGAGFPPFLSSGEATRTEVLDVSNELRVAFGKFVELSRRNNALSIEQLAQKAEVDPSELLVIEEDIHYIPEPRTVYQLARFFNLSQKLLMQLAGLAHPRDPQLAKGAVRFAARSEPATKLNATEKEALESFVALLSKME